jgi:hypothetical protein
MKDYKGIYHNTTSTTNYYEFGAHFKYLDLYNALNQLKKERTENIPLNEESSLKLEIKEEKEPSKKRKKYKLKTMDTKETKRNLGLVTDINENSKEKRKKEFSTIEEEQDNDKDKKRQKKRLLTKSLDKMVLPKINIKNSNNEDNLTPTKLMVEKKEKNNYQFGRLSKSLNLKKKNVSEKKENFPKINSVYYRDIIIENKNNKTQRKKPRVDLKIIMSLLKYLTTMTKVNLKEGKF